MRQIQHIEGTSRFVAAMPRQVHVVCTAAATSLLAIILSLGYVAATMIFTCHTMRFVAANCRSDVSHSVSRPLQARQQNFILEKKNDAVC